MSKRRVPPLAGRSKAPWSGAPAAWAATVRSAAAWPAVAWGAVGLLYALLLASSWVTPDIFYHLELGRRFWHGGGFQPAEPTLVSQPGFVNFYWLFQAIAHPLYAAGGSVLLSLVFLLAGLATLLLAFDTAGLFRQRTIGLPIGLIAVLILQQRVEPRPEALSYLLLAVLVRWLVRWEWSGGGVARRLVLIGTLTAVWTNLHGYFALAPLLTGLRWGASFTRRSQAAERRPLGWAVLVALAATCVSPFGAGAWRGVLVQWRFLREMRGEILEFGPPVGPFLVQWTIWVFWLAWAALAGFVLFAALRRRVSLFALGSAVAALYLSASAARNLPLLVFLGAPLVGKILCGGRGVGVRPSPGAAPTHPTAPRTARTAHRHRWSGVAVTGLAILLSAWVIEGGFYRAQRMETRWGPRLEPHAYPIAAVTFLQRLSGDGTGVGFAGTIFNSAADGGYIAYRLPGARPYIDSRYVDTGPVRAYFSALRDPSAFDALHAVQRFDAVLLKVVDSPNVVSALLARPEWRMLYADLHRVAFVWRTGPWADQAGPSARLYAGEDLGRRVDGRAAIAWMQLFVRLGRRELIAAALSDFGTAPRIPSFVLQIPLEAALRAGDREMVERIRTLRPRMVALRPEDAAAVDRLLGSSMVQEPRR